MNKNKKGVTVKRHATKLMQKKKLPELLDLKIPIMISKKNHCGNCFAPICTEGANRTPAIAFLLQHQNVSSCRQRQQKADDQENLR